MLFSLIKHYLELYITDNALKVSTSLYCFTISMSHGVEIISPGCGVRASLMLFLFISIEFVLLGLQSALFEGEITMKYLHFYVLFV